MLHIEAMLFSEIFQISNASLSDGLQFHATAGYTMDRKSTLVLILGCPLLICTKFEVDTRQQFVQGQQTRWLTTSDLFTWNVPSTWVKSVLN